MVGLIALIIFIIYIGIALFFIYKVKGIKKKAFVSLIFILIPTADVIVGSIYFKYICSKYSGAFVYRRVGIGDEYYLQPGEEDNSRWTIKLDFLTKKNGQKINRKKFKQHYVFIIGSSETYSKLFHIYKRELIVLNKRINEILSKYILYSYGGGWVENIYKMGGTSKRCPTRLLDSDLLGNKTFYPVNDQ